MSNSVPKYERDDAVDPFVSDGVELTEEEAGSHGLGVQRPINHAALLVVFRRQEIQRFRQNLQSSSPHSYHQLLLFIYYYYY